MQFIRLGDVQLYVEFRSWNDGVHRKYVFDGFFFLNNDFGTPL